MYETECNKERLILVSTASSFKKMPGRPVQEEKDDDGEFYNPSLKELAQLAKTAGADIIGQLTQERPKPHPTHYLGKGKVEELKIYGNAVGATGILCNDELNSAQIKNLNKSLDLKILDRTMIILDIFANRAISAEGKAQVEIAQLKYRLSRLSGLDAQFSRQGGGTGGLGIGARGPGEKKLETGRRHIKERIKQLAEELKEIRAGRAILREKRIQAGLPVIALVGYTNAGKSTLMNALTSANVLAEDKLFATLDTTTRRLKLPAGTEVLITDTVGFIDKLPHHLIQAFRATLEELKYATILLHVVDISKSNFRENSIIIYNVLKELHCLDKPIIEVFNKADIACEECDSNDIYVSAKTGKNLKNLLSVCEETLQSISKKATFIIPYEESHLLNLIHKNCEILSKSYEETGTKIEAYVPSKMHFKLLTFFVEI